jgi:hypothetical protein
MANDYLDAQNYVLSKEQKDKVWDLYIESDYNNIESFVDSILRHEYFRKEFGRS